MLIHVEQRHIDEATRVRDDRSLPWGCRCPIARATCEQLGLPLGSVYAGPISTYVNWQGNGVQASEFNLDDCESRWFTTDRALAFMAKMDNVCDSLDIEPCIVELSQRPAHVPGHYTPEGWLPLNGSQWADDP